MNSQSLSARLIAGTRWGFFGGAFDPPHLGHLSLAQELCDRESLDGILFVVSARPPHKDSPVASFSQRLTMTKLACQGYSDFAVCDLEQQIDGPGYTTVVIKRLQEMYTGVEFVIAVGADNLEILNKWYQIEELLRLVTVVVGLRPGASTEGTLLPKLAERVTIHQTPLLDISSSDIRRQIKKRLSPAEYVPESVVHYLEQEKLYL